MIKEWFTQKLQGSPLQPVSDTMALDIRSRALVLKVQGNAMASGEAKRHMVYAQLIKEFPALPHRTLSMAIEYAVQDVL